MPPAPKIMFVCSRLIGRVRATAELARRLEAHGYDVIFAAPAEVSALIKTGNGRFLEIEALDLGGVSAGKRTGLSDFWPATRKKRLQTLEATLNIEQFEHLLATEKPDLTVVDAEMHPHIVAALGMRKRVALLSDLFLSQPSAAAPPLDCSLSPSQNSVTEIRRAWIRLWIRWRAIQMKRWMATGGADYLSLLRSMAHARGVDWRTHTTRWWWQVPVAWRQIPLIVLQGWELDFPMEYDPQLLHVGPMLSPPRPATERNLKVLEIAEEARKQAKRVIYIGFGASFKAQEKVVRKVWKAVEACPNIVAIHSIAGRTDFALRDTPPNVVLVDWAPQDQLLKLCDAAIIHAGINTVLECLAGGTPMLAIPRGIDQPGNAARITFHGLGHTLTTGSSAEQITSRLRDLLDDPSYRHRCADMHRALQAYEQNKTAESVFGRLVGQSTTHDGGAPEQNE